MYRQLKWFKRVLWIICIILVALFVPKIVEWAFSISFTEFTSLNEIRPTDILNYIAPLFNILCTAIIGWLAYRSEQKARELEERIAIENNEKYERGIQPSVMVEKVSCFLTEVGIGYGNVREYTNVTCPHYLDTEIVVKEKEYICLEVSVINTSEFFCRVKMYNSKIGCNKQIHEFNSSTDYMGNQYLYLKGGERDKFALLMNKDINLTGTNCSIEVIMHNSLGDAYKQKTNFVIPFVPENIRLDTNQVPFDLPIIFGSVTPVEKLK